MLAPIVAGVALLAAFVAWERRSTHPLIDLSLFSNRDFTVGTALSTVANFALFGLLFVMPQYFQDVGGSDPLGTGVRLLPMIGGMIVATRIGPRLVKRAGSRFVIVAGLALSAAALGLAATTEVDTGYAFAALWITLLGAGIGLVLPASVGAAMGALSAERAGSGSGLMQALRQVGATIGVAVLGTVLSSGYHSQLEDGNVPASAEGAVRSSVGAGIEVAQRLDSSALAQTVRSAFVHGMDTVLLASAALTILGAVIAVLFLPRRVAETPAPTSSSEEPVQDRSANPSVRPLPSTSPPLGLRERKKIKLRRSVQREALRLFAEQGYEDTTVEQIADAADISTTTFYRYFPTKEDVVLEDEYDPIAEHIMGSGDEEEPLVATVRAAIAAVAAAVEADRDAALARLKLIATVPALKARQGAEGRKAFDFYIRLFSGRSGRPVGDYQLRVTTAAFTAAQLEAARCWADADGAESLGRLMDDAVTLVEPLIAAL